MWSFARKLHLTALDLGLLEAGLDFFACFNHFVSHCNRVFPDLENPIVHFATHNSALPVGPVLSTEFLQNFNGRGAFQHNFRGNLIEPVGPVLLHANHVVYPHSVRGPKHAETPSGGLLRNVELGTSGVDSLPVERGPHLSTSTLDSDTDIVIENSSAELVGPFGMHDKDDET